MSGDSMSYDELYSERLRLIDEINNLHHIIARQNVTLAKIADTLDRHLGDTDPELTHLTDDEIRDSDPVWWCCREANITLEGGV